MSPDETNTLDKDIIADRSLRDSIDEGLQTLKSLPTSRERSLAIASLREAVMQLGMDLKRLGANSEL